MANAMKEYYGATLLIPVEALGPACLSPLHGACMTIDGPPLSERQIVDDVSILSPGQAAHMGPIFILAQRVVGLLKLTGDDDKVVVCVWPDHVAAVLSFDATQGRPRAKQLVRSYYAARAGMPRDFNAPKKQGGGEPC